MKLNKFALMAAWACGLLLAGCPGGSGGDVGCDGIDLNSDTENCGECGNVCKEHQICKEGSCACDEGYTECDDECKVESDCSDYKCKDVDLKTDKNNCGKCGEACSANQVCKDGKCVCGEGYEDCAGDGVCKTVDECASAACGGADLKKDPKNCGKCKNECKSGEVCTDGNCACDEGFVHCDGDETKCISEEECNKDKCEPGQTRECYSGDLATKGVGSCKAGEYQCGSDGKFDETVCVGEVLPSRDSYVCDPDEEAAKGDEAQDRDCNDVKDYLQDDDKDGAKFCGPENGYDCCDNKDQGCPVPGNVFPDNTECNGDHVDNNCNGKVDEDDVVTSSDGSTMENPQCSSGTETEDRRCQMTVRTCGNDEKYQYWFNYDGSFDEKTYDKSQYRMNNEEALNTAISLAKAFDVCMDLYPQNNKPGILEVSLTQSEKPIVQSMSNPGREYVYKRQVNIKSGMYAAKRENGELVKDDKGNFVRDEENMIIKPPNDGKATSNKSTSFIVLSTGGAGDASEAAHDKDGKIADEKFGGKNEVPGIFLTSHNNNLSSHSACTKKEDESNPSVSINDSVRFHLKLMPPEGAKAFQFQFKFYSREYPMFLCSKFNDFFITLLTDEEGKPMTVDGEPIKDPKGNPITDGNISFDENGNPISISSAFFTSCEEPKCGYESLSNEAIKGADGCPKNLTCSDGVCGKCLINDIAGYYPEPYSSANDSGKGGGTKWLTTRSNIEPGKPFNLDFYIWDTSDKAYDSMVILDDFQWLCGTTSTETRPTEEMPPIIDIN